MGKEVLRRPIEIVFLSSEEVAKLDELYRSTRVVRLRTRAQIVSLAAGERLTAAAIVAIAASVRESEETVRLHLNAQEEG